MPGAVVAREWGDSLHRIAGQVGDCLVLCWLIMEGRLNRICSAGIMRM